MRLHLLATAQEVCGPDSERWSDGRCVPEGLIDPPATWLLDYVIPSFAAIMVVVMVADAIRKRRLTWWLLISVCSAMTWWMETFGDWAQHLSYSPAFNHYTLTWKFTAPHNPMWMPMMYAVYWVAHAWAILRIAQWAGRRQASPTPARRTRGACWWWAGCRHRPRTRGTRAARRSPASASAACRPSRAFAHSSGARPPSSF